MCVCVYVCVCVVLFKYPECLLDHHARGVHHHSTSHCSQQQTTGKQVGQLCTQKVGHQTRNYIYIYIEYIVCIYIYLGLDQRDRETLASAKRIWRGKVWFLCCSRALLVSCLTIPRVGNAMRAVNRRRSYDLFQFTATFPILWLNFFCVSNEILSDFKSQAKVSKVWTYMYNLPLQTI